MRDGQKVSYIGPDDQGLVLGDRGEVISAAGSASHVLWTSGALKDEVVLIDNMDIAPVGKQTQAKVADGLDDSLEVGVFTVTAAREMYDEAGEVGLLNEMAAQGFLASFVAIAQEASDLIQTRIRNDPSFRAVTAQLEDEEADSLVRLASFVLVRDAFGEPE